MGNTDKQVEELVKEWFGKKATEEWGRLQCDPYRQIEYMITVYFL